MSEWNQPASAESLNRTVKALKEHGFEVLVVERDEAKAKVISLVPEGSLVMTNTSVTLKELGITEELDTSDKFDSVRCRFAELDSEKDKQEMKRLGGVPDVSLGSVHALTENGSALIASASGSQLPAAAYGAEKVIFVVGAQKIVGDVPAGLKRIYEHVFPLEDKRAMEAYGAHSGVNKILILNKEPVAGRTTFVIVKAAIGF